MLEKKDLLFSFIMKYGEICDKFELTEEMKVAKENYKNDNQAIDYLLSSLTKHMILCLLIVKIKR